MHWSIKFAMITSTKVSKEWKHSFGAFLRCMYTQWIVSAHLLKANFVWADVQGKEIRK